MRSVSNTCKVVPLVLLLAFGLTSVAVAKSAAGPSTAELAGKVGDRTFTLEEVDEQLRATNSKVFQDLYNARKAALDQLVEEHLIEQEAKKKGVTSAQLVKTEITDKIKAVTDEEVAAFYEGNKGRMGGQPLEQMAARIKPYLVQQEETKARTALIGGLKSQASVKIMLDAPRVTMKIADDDPTKGGTKSAPVQIAEFSDFQCPFCSRVGPTLKKLEDTYGDKIRLAFRHFPLAMHNDAQKAAEASECARVQGKFWEYHDTLWENQRALGIDQLKEYAKTLSLDSTKFDKCLDSGEMAAGVKKDMAEGAAAGVTGTPAFFVNGRFLSGAQPFEAFQAIIDEELARAGT